MDGAIPEQEKQRRLAFVQDHQRQIQITRNAALVGSTQEVLVDSRHAARGQWSGRTSGSRVVNFVSQHENLLGRYARVRVERSGPNSLVGEHVLDNGRSPWNSK